GPSSPCLTACHYHKTPPPFGAERDGAQRRFSVKYVCEGSYGKLGKNHGMTSRLRRNRNQRNHLRPGHKPLRLSRRFTGWRINWIESSWITEAGSSCLPTIKGSTLQIWHFEVLT